MHEKRTTCKYEPALHADHLGIRVEYGDPGEGNLGLHEDGVITLAEGMSHRLERSVLAHEIVHHQFEDEATDDWTWHAKREARCDRIAAERLIDPCHLLELAALTHDKGYWAVELNVAGWLLDAYLKEHPDGLH